MTLSANAFLVASIIVVFGFLAFVYVASKSRANTRRIYNFFVAGQTLPPALAGQVYWGNSLALGNGIAFFATLTLFWGPAALWVQVPWVLGMFALGYLAPAIGKATRRHTIHGFLGEQIGFGSQLLTACVTSFGFILNMGFEVMIGAMLLAFLFGSTDIIWPAIITLSLFFAAYCNIGGYRANARTDKIQNILGLLVVFALVTYFWIFTPEKIVSGREQFIRDIFDFGKVPIAAYIGMCLYAFFVQFVDMSNWQNISATRLSGEKWKEEIRREFTWAALKSLAIPGLLCVMLAAPLLGTDATDERLIGEILMLALPTSGPLAGVLWGIALLALLGTMQSTADSFLMASTQTLVWDIANKKQVSEVLECYADDAVIKEAASHEFELIDQEDAHENRKYLEHALTSNARLALFPIALVGSCALYGISTYLTDNIIQIMFLVFGSQLALVPATLLALRAQQLSMGFEKVFRLGLMISIALGFVASISTVFVNPSIPGIVDYAPYFALGISSVCVLLFVTIKKFQIYV